MKKVLITGVSGFIGPHLAEVACSKGWQVIGVDLLDCDINLPNFTFIKKDVRSLDVEELKGVEYVFHLAFVTNIPNSIQNPLPTTYDNIDMTAHLLDLSKQAGVEKFLFPSTGSLYGDNPTPWREDMSASPMEPYSWQKLSCEYACKTWTERYGLPTVIFRFFQVFGENQRYDTALAAFFRAKKESRPITLTETTAQSSFRTAQRDFIYVKEVVAAVVRAAESEKTGGGEIINIGSGRVATMEDVAKAVGSEVVFIPRRSFEVERHEADITKAEELLDWHPKVDIIEWIKKYINTNSPMKEIKFVKNKECRMCGSDTFEEVIDLGSHPLANTLLSREDFDQEDPLIPLQVRQCQKCYLVQMTQVVDEAELYQNVDYLYYSSDMPGLVEYHKEYVSDIRERFLQGGDFVVELASNDGVMLNLLRDECRVLGVDPATTVALRALNRSIPTIASFFSERLARQIKKEWGSPKVIVANNCIAHVNDMHDITRGIQTLLDDEGTFIMEEYYWGSMVKNANYSLIYPDHYSFFSLKVLQQYFEKYGIKIFDAVVTPAQGGALRIFASKQDLPVTARLKDLEGEEEANKLNSYEAIVLYRERVRTIIENLKKVVEELKGQGKSIAGYCASSKAFPILRSSGIDDKLDYFVDDSPAKQGRYTPVNHTPVISRQEAEGRLPDYFIILAPNYTNFILEKEKRFRENGGKFILAEGGIDVI